MAIEVSFTSNLEEILPLVKTATEQTLLDIGVTVQGRAADGSPVRTGALRSSWTVELDSGENSVTIGVPVGALERNYAKYVELGTSKMRGQHMLSNAVESSSPLFEGIARANFENA